jgi:hypothetical protein
MMSGFVFGLVVGLAIGVWLGSTVDTFKNLLKK